MMDMLVSASASSSRRFDARFRPEAKFMNTPRGDITCRKRDYRLLHFKAGHHTDAIREGARRTAAGFGRHQMTPLGFARTPDASGHGITIIDYFSFTHARNFGTHRPADKRPGFHFWPGRANSTAALDHYTPTRCRAFITMY